MPSIEADAEHDRARLLVAVGVVRRADGRILLAWRDARRHQGGCWEFPGGKVHDDETVQQALRRELAEEVGIIATCMQPLIRIPHVYPERAVLLDVHEVTAFDGKARGLEGQRIQWVDPDRLRELPLPEANRPIVTAALLPRLCLITPDPVDQTDSAFLDALERALARGVKLVQLRAHRLRHDRCRLRRLAASSLRRCSRHGAQLLLNADPELAVELGAGLHLPAWRLRTLSEPPPRAPGRLLGASCHSADELADAVDIGADFAVLGPVAETLTHPGQPGMGFAAFQQLVADLPLPVYAIGGMSSDLLAQAIDHGAQGVAAIRALWSEQDDSGQVSRQ